LNSDISKEILLDSEKEKDLTVKISLLKNFDIKPQTK